MAEKAEAQSIRDYLANLERRGMAKSSVARKLSAIRQFHLFLHSENLSSVNPAAIVEGPGTQRALPTVIAADEVLRLAEAAREAVPAKPLTARLKALRNLCLIELLAATGLRVSELVGLKYSAAVSDKEFLTIRGKGGGSGWCPFRRALEAFLRATWESCAKAARRSRNGSFRRAAHRGRLPGSTLHLN